MTISATDPLRPVRDALLARARADAHVMLDQADKDGTASLARDQDRAEAILADARAQGEADARLVVDAERARARRRARGVVLAAQREVYEDLRTGVRQAVRALRDDPAYDGWRERMGDQARAALGADTVVTDHPGGGVLAEARGRRVECTLDGLAEQAIAALATDLEGLWAP